jgi:hypothetical protein
MLGESARPVLTSTQVVLTQSQTAAISNMSDDCSIKYKTRILSGTVLREKPFHDGHVTVSADLILENIR